MTTRKRLCAIKGISEAKVDKIKVLVLFSAPSLYGKYETEQDVWVWSGYGQTATPKLMYP